MTRFGVIGSGAVGHAVMVNPSFSGGRATMFYCGNDPEAKATVARIINQFGWEGADMGTAKRARSSRSVSSGAFPDSCRRAGDTPSSC